MSFAGSRGTGIQAKFSFVSPAEESPDCMEQGVLLKRRMPWTIIRGKTSATESIPPEPPGAGKGEKVV